MSRLAVKERMRLSTEIKKISTYPGVVYKNGRLDVDMWCNGNESESDRVFLATRTLRNILSRIQEVENENIP